MNSKALYSFALSTLLLLATGCSLTKQAKIDTAKMDCTIMGSVCSSLQKGGEGQADLRYIRPGVNWQQYNSILIRPVTFWAGESNSISPSDQQAIVNFTYQSLEKSLSKNFKLVQQPTMGTLILQVALTDAETATPFLRSVSMIIPQLHMLANLKNLATGSYPFVGGAQVEATLTDASTGQIIAAVADRRMGGGAFRAGFQWQWGDAENAVTAWSDTLAKKLTAWTSGTEQAM